MIRATLLLAAIVLIVNACGGSSPSVPSSSTPAVPTRIIGLNGNLAFGNVQLGSRGSATFVITNNGTATLTVSGLSITSGLSAVYTANWTSGTIAAGTSQPVTIQFAPTAAQAYNGTLSVNADQTAGANTISISGTGIAPVSCTYALSIGSTIDGYPNGGPFNVTVTTSSACPWTASSGVSWIHVPAQTSNTGTGAFTFTVDGNTGVARTGTITIAGQTVTFNQTSTAAPSPGPGPGPTPTTPPTTLTAFYVWGGANYSQYLGYFSCVFCTEFGADSINNLFGIYGSQFSLTSIRNQFGTYGSQFSTYSACDQFAFNPPRVFNANRTIYYGELTLNQFRLDAIKVSTIVGWLSGDVCRH